MLVGLLRLSEISVVAYDVRWWKDDRTGGRKDREVESERRRCGRNGGDTGITKNTKVRIPRVTKLFIKKHLPFSFTIFRFIEINDEELR